LRTGYKDILQSFFEKFVAPSVLECWIWTGAKNWDDYGMIITRNPRRVWIASRFSYEMFKMPIPKGLKVLHRCDTPACVNPCHLFLGTDKDNAEDRRSKGRPAGGTITKLRRNFCARGHEYTPENLKIRATGHRVCRVCMRINSANYYADKKTGKEREHL
jgi:HNH endonuclease